jgi:PAS domain S-box-containing protein
MTWVGPGVAFLLALLIGRSISLGVTRPLEALTRATEEISREQKGGSAAASAALLLDSLEDDAPDDEVGDLQRAFGRMARTIGQREAVLRAQNQALGALNRRVEAVLNATNDGIVLVSQNGGFSVVNQRAGDLLGLDPEILLDQTFAQGAPLLFGRFKEAGAARERFQELLPDGQSVADETFELAADGQQRVLRVYSAPVRDGEVAASSNGSSGDAAATLPPAGAGLMGRIFVFRDVTRETVVDRMKTEFIGVVSHELRTPLTAIKGYVDLMLAGQTGPVTPLQTEFLGIVQSSTARLSALINDMLDISRIESGRIEVKHDAVDFGVVAHEVVATLRHEAEAKQIALTLDVPPDLPPVSGDADRITQVLLNLISNAIKYTPARGRVRVSVEATRNSFVTTCVEDTGIGIAPDDQARVFQKFFRADNSLTREASGTGLGLAITRAIIEKLNGSIWVESEPGQGSRFFFTLPTAFAVSAARAEREQAEREQEEDAPAAIAA